jgi:acyl-CoA thioesterase-1
MRRIVPVPLLVLIGLMFMSPAEAKSLVMIGDSLTEGYGVARDKAFPALVQGKIKSLGKDWKVVNSGISGSTSASAAGRVSWALKQKPDIILLALGANDGLRGLDVKALEDNLDRAILLAVTAKAKVVLAGMQMPPNFGRAYTQSFAAVYPRLAKKHSLTFIPFLLEGVAAQASLNQSDGIHPNEKGHVIVAETVFKVMEPLL